MVKKCPLFPFPLLIFSIFLLQIAAIVRGETAALDDNHHEDARRVGSLVRKDERESLVSTEYGEISAVGISDGARSGGRNYHLQFITLEPNALFLPVLLHADMVFYVHSGSGRLSWINEDEKRGVNLQRGDVYRLQPGTVFFVQSNLETERQKLRIYAIFTNPIQDSDESSMGAYSSIRDLVLGFDRKVLQEAFKVPGEVIEEIKSGKTPSLIVHAPPRKGKKTLWEFETPFMEALLGRRGYSMFEFNNKKHKTKTFNILKADPEVENCNGWSLAVTKKNLPALRGSNIGLFMVNLTKGSMMGPHWNPMASEISIVVQGQGMVRVVCSSTMTESECKSMRFRVKEGDVFVVPRFNPMAQMAFNNDSLVFVGFSTSAKKNHPQFLAGKASVLQALDRQVVAASFNVNTTIIEQLLSSQGESIILDCTSCAEEEESLMEEEIEKEREEARKKEEEERRRRRRRREEEKRREEEEARKREEEERRKEEEKRKEHEGEEEEARREEEERRRQEEEEEEEEEARRREEAAARKREEEKEEEETRRRREEEEGEEEEEGRRRKEHRREQEERRRRRQEEAEREEKEAKREEEARRRGEAEEEEEARRKEQKRAQERKRESEEEEEAEREEGARRREEEEAEEVRREQEERRRRRGRAEEEEEEAEREEEARRREEEEARRKEQKREQEKRRRRREETETEEEEARREEQEREEMERQEEKARRQREKHRQEEEEERGGGSEGENRKVFQKMRKI